MLLNIKEIISVFVDWIYLAQDRNRRLTVETKLKNSRLNSSGSISVKENYLVSILISFLISVQKISNTTCYSSGNFGKIYFKGERIPIMIASFGN